MNLDQYPTPLTYANTICGRACLPGNIYVTVEFALNLERQNAALKDELHRLRDVVSGTDIELIDAALSATEPK